MEHFGDSSRENMVISARKMVIEARNMVISPRKWVIQAVNMMSQWFNGLVEHEKNRERLKFVPSGFSHLSDGGIDQSLEQSSGFLSEFIAYHTT